MSPLPLTYCIYPSESLLHQLKPVSASVPLYSMLLVLSWDLRAVETLLNRGQDIQYEKYL